MTKELLKIILAFAFLLLSLNPEIIIAETKQIQLNIKAEVKNLSKLELDSTITIFDVGSFSPDDIPKINSTPGQVMISCKSRTGENSSVTLTILARLTCCQGPIESPSIMSVGVFPGQDLVAEHWIKPFPNLWEIGLEVVLALEQSLSI